MHAQNLLVNDGSNWQTIETIRKGLPQFNIISSLALLVETINAIDACALVITTQNKEVLGIFDLVGQ